MTSEIVTVSQARGGGIKNGLPLTVPLEEGLARIARRCAEIALNPAREVSGF